MKIFKIDYYNKKDNSEMFEEVSFLTFQEAARKAYSKRYSMGHDWVISSISELRPNNRNSSQLVLPLGV